MGRRNPRRKLNISNKSLTVLVCILAVVCLAAGGIYIDTFYGKGMFQSFLNQRKQTEAVQSEETAPAESMAVDISSKASMAVFGKEFLLCTKDGVKYFTSMGDQKWSDTFNMSSPTLIQEGNYMAVGDMGGKVIRVYNRDGMLYDLQAEGSPVQFALNESGYLSLITKSENAYRIRIYNAKGTLLKERVEESSGIYPLSSDVSDDSRVFAVSYLDTTDISPIGRVLLFYIAAEDSEDFTDSMFAAVEKTDEIIPVISYRKNGALAVISDTGVYGIGSDGSELWNYPLENTIDQAALGNKEYIVLALGDSVANKDGRDKGTVCWLDGSGQERASFETGESVTYLFSGDKGVVIGNERDYTGVTHSGNESWNYTATSDMSDLIPMEKLNRVMAVGKEQVSIYDMTKAQAGETGTKPAENTAAGEQDTSADKETGKKEDAATQRESTTEDTQQEESPATGGEEAGSSNLDEPSAEEEE
ncbi:DUF5711 family protein [Anaerotignum sp.]